MPDMKMRKIRPKGVFERRPGLRPWPTFDSFFDDQNQVRRRVPFRDYACKLGLPHYPGRRIGAMRLGALPFEQQQKLALIKGASFVGANASVWKRTHALPGRPEYCV
jgi:hypothetical protein